MFNHKQSLSVVSNIFFFSEMQYYQPQPKLQVKLSFPLIQQPTHPQPPPGKVYIKAYLNSKLNYASLA